MNDIRVFNIGWHLSDGKIYDVDGYRLLHEGGQRDTLPVEFFSHQLMELDCENEGEVMQFMTEYGMPKWPSRFGLGGFGPQPAYDAMEISDNYHAYDLTGNFELVYCSYDEAVWSFKALQGSIKNMFDYLACRVDDWSLASLINAGASNSIAAHTGYRQFPDNNLTNAICNQVLETLASDLPWETCACDGCGRMFKRFQPGNTRVPKTERKPTKSKYCCKACQDRQGQRNRRAAARNRIKH